MGTDMYHLSNSINRENGILAENILNRIIDVLDDDKPFKEKRIESIVNEYQNNYQEI